MTNTNSMLEQMEDAGSLRSEISAFLDSGSSGRRVCGTTDLRRPPMTSAPAGNGTATSPTTDTPACIGRSNTAEPPPRC